MPFIPSLHHFLLLLNCLFFFAGLTGTWVLSVLAGHRRYAHVTALRSDSALPELMGDKPDRQRRISF
jgi:hypothetical protein